jgi:RNAse (barnase) inhibitor barstar
MIAVEGLPEVRELVLDASTWNNADDVYDSFFRAVGAPAWHGRNLDALNDSIAGGDINKTEVPYRIVICNYDHIGVGAKQMAERFVDLIRDLAAGDTPVEIVVRASE